MFIFKGYMKTFGTGWGFVLALFQVVIIIVSAIVLFGSAQGLQRTLFPPTYKISDEQTQAIIEKAKLAEKGVKIDAPKQPERKWLTNKY